MEYTIIDTNKIGDNYFAKFKQVLGNLFAKQIQPKFSWFLYIYVKERHQSDTSNFWMYIKILSDLD